MPGNLDEIGTDASWQRWLIEIGMLRVHGVCE